VGGYWFELAFGSTGQIQTKFLVHFQDSCTDLHPQEIRQAALRKPLGLQQQHQT
jgi:hypothetical protein